MPDITQGGTTLPIAIPCDAIFCGITGYLQALELDAGASKGVSFTAGLALTLGE